MHHSWMIEVIEDLRDYADKNDLIAVGEALRLTSTVANAELQGLAQDASVSAVERPANVLLFRPIASPLKYQA